jgi:hypothetical protein
MVNHHSYALIVPRNDMEMRGRMIIEIHLNAAPIKPLHRRHGIMLVQSLHYRK